MNTIRKFFKDVGTWIVHAKCQNFSESKKLVLSWKYLVLLFQILDPDTSPTFTFCDIFISFQDSIKRYTTCDWWYKQEVEVNPWPKNTRCNSCSDEMIHCSKCVYILHVQYNAARINSYRCSRYYTLLVYFMLHSRESEQFKLLWTRPN